MSTQPTWDPEFPTPGALKYKAEFIASAAEGGLRAIPDAVLSQAITRALERGVSAERAGSVFADAYFKFQKRITPRGGWDSAENYLLAVYSSQLEDKNVL